METARKTESKADGEKISTFTHTLNLKLKFGLWQNPEICGSLGKHHFRDISKAGI